MKKKIGIFSSGLEQMGGISSIVKNLCHALNEKYDITVFGINSDETKNGIEYIDGIKLFKSSFKKKFISRYLRSLYFRLAKRHYIFQYFLPKRIIFNIVYKKSQLKKVKKYIEKENFDFLIGCSVYATICIKYLKNKNAKTIGWLHEEFKVYTEPGYFLYYLYKITKNHGDSMDNWIVLTENEKRHVDSFFNVNSIVINNAIFVDKEFIKRKLCSFSYVGRVIKELKQCDHAVDIFREIKSFPLNIYGEGPFLQELKKAENKSNFILHGRVNDIELIYNNTDCLVLTSESEGFGMVIIEAFAYSIPVISYNINNVNEIIIDGYNGILVEKNDINAFRKAIERLIYNPELYAKLSRNAYESSKQYQISDIREKWINLFEKI